MLKINLSNFWIIYQFITFKNEFSFFPFLKVQINVSEIKKTFLLQNNSAIFKPNPK